MESSLPGDTVKTVAICLRIAPWSKTSHVVTWLTPAGKVTTLVKGAVRPKSAFLGQYDLNYECELVYYARERGEIHATRECSIMDMRENLRGEWRLLAMAEYFRDLVSRMAPWGEEAKEWYALLNGALASLAPRGEKENVAALIRFELDVLSLAGLKPDLDGEKGAFSLRGERSLAVSPGVLQCLKNPEAEKNFKILLDTAGVIGVFYNFHVDYAADCRRSVLKMISETKRKENEEDET